MFLSSLGSYSAARNVLGCAAWFTSRQFCRVCTLEWTSWVWDYAHLRIYQIMPSFPSLHLPGQCQPHLLPVQPVATLLRLW